MLKIVLHFLLRGVLSAVLVFSELLPQGLGTVEAGTGPDIANGDMRCFTAPLTSKLDCGDLSVPAVLLLNGNGSYRGYDLNEDTGSGFFQIVEEMKRQNYKVGKNIFRYSYAGMTSSGYNNPYTCQMSAQQDIKISSDYLRSYIEAFDKSQPKDRKLILVGYSQGGLIISQSLWFAYEAAEMFQPRDKAFADLLRRRIMGAATFHSPIMGTTAVISQYLASLKRDGELDTYHPEDCDIEAWYETPIMTMLLMAGFQDLMART